MSISEIIIIIGKRAPKPKPPLRLPSQKFKAANETTHGPSVQPISPESAKMPNILFPPLGNFLAARLKVPGHIILMQIPVKAQKVSERY